MVFTSKKVPDEKEKLRSKYAKPNRRSILTSTMECTTIVYDTELAFLHVESSSHTSLY